MQIYYDSRLAKYKSKLGALKTDESTMICVFAQEIYNLQIKIESDVGSTIQNMKHHGDFWYYELIAPSVPCVLFYTFLFCANNKDYCLGADNNSGQGRSTVYNAVKFDNGAVECNPKPFSFQITVYDKAFLTPNWSKNAVMYQIFPDRFCRGNKDNLIQGKIYHENCGRYIIAHENWNEDPVYTPVNGNSDYFPCDFYGGDLAGIESELDYLQKLSVNVIYLNPICEASSNHRYDTADYMKVDPILGTNYDFSHLCDMARERGIKIILDGVFSHTGSDSVYFNKNSSYKTVGAYQGNESQFYSWYKFGYSCDDYESWWGFKTLPEVNEQNSDWQKYIITSKNGVFYNWLNMGANGFRLDVADELPDNVIELMRETLKNENSENFLLGEVWEDATTKQSYGQNRKYALGNALDSVMNYPFRSNCLNFLQEKITAFDFCVFLSAQALNYPQQMYYSLMNLISSHDVPRAKTILATGVNGECMSRNEQAKFKLTQEQEEKGESLLKLATALQFAIPGMPCIYYGDEQGLDGLKDPFNRTTFSHKNNDLADKFAEIAAIHQKLQVLKTGDVSFLAINQNVIAVLRFNVSNKDFFNEPALNEAAVIVINTANTNFNIAFSLNDFEICIEKTRLNEFRECNFSKAYDLLANIPLEVVQKNIHFNIEAKDYKIFHFN